MSVVVTSLLYFAEINKSRQAEIWQRHVAAQFGCCLVAAVSAGLTLRISSYSVSPAQAELFAAVQLFIRQLAVEIQQQVYCIAQTAAVVNVAGQLMEAAFCFAVKIFVGKLSPIVKRTVACIDAAASTVAADSCMYGITAFFSVVTKQAHFILQLTVVVAVDQV